MPREAARLAVSSDNWPDNASSTVDASDLHNRAFDNSAALGRIAGIRTPADHNAYRRKSYNSPFPPWSIPTSAGPLPPFQRFLTPGHRYHRGDGPEGSGGKPWAFTLSALGYYLIIPVTILKAALPTLQIRRAQLAGVYHCASLVKLFFVSIPQLDYKNRIYYPYPFLRINNHSKKITEYWPVNWNLSRSIRKRERAPTAERPREASRTFSRRYTE